MKKFLWIIVFVVSVVISYFIWKNSPEYLRQGGPLLVLGLTLLFLLFTFTVERAIVLARASGRGGIAPFMRTVKSAIQEGKMESAIKDILAIVTAEKCRTNPRRVSL